MVEQDPRLHRDKFDTGKTYEQASREAARLQEKVTGGPSETKEGADQA